MMNVRFHETERSVQPIPVDRCHVGWDGFLPPDPDVELQLAQVAGMVIMPMGHKQMVEAVDPFPQKLGTQVGRRIHQNVSGSAPSQQRAAGALEARFGDSFPTRRAVAVKRRHAAACPST